MDRHENWTGRRVRCIRGWKRIGLKRGETYTVACRVNGLFLSAADMAEPKSGLSPEGPTAPHRISIKQSGTVQFATPKLILAEMGFPYLLDMDRFEPVA